MKTEKINALDMEGLLKKYKDMSIEKKINEILFNNSDGTMDYNTRDGAKYTYSDLDMNAISNRLFDLFFMELERSLKGQETRMNETINNTSEKTAEQYALELVKECDVFYKDALDMLSISNNMERDYFIIKKMISTKRVLFSSKDVLSIISILNE